ncbi:putative type VI secretion protein, periplasmic solute-binding protein VtsC [Aliivibrio wodanis]|uniref:Putative type VI secretion protein, periplasmic solute-binding protein VtsC n=1 Tax=Aliivibrio wodanis TaxID=80852 RepID=A0A090I792_9GAMM|nr:putative type VI secretion protein, periplasmic solute-binding protein VtsC [Aliivibrio wodanis]VVV05721.1 hypothetical protein AW0309160_03204 [Aliivibrio wodanis]
MIARAYYLVILLMSLTVTPVVAAWPSWLGEELKNDDVWQINEDKNFVEFIPYAEHPKVWVLVSRKAKSYDTALGAMLKVYKRELSTATFRVFLLPSEPEQLQHLLNQAEKQASLIYTVGSKATVAVHQLYAGGQLPVVSVNAKDPVLLGLTDTYKSSHNNFAYTSLNLPANITLSFLSRFNPELRQIGVLYAKSNTSAYVTQFLPLKQEAEANGISVFAIEVDESQPESSLDAIMSKQVSLMEKQDPNFEQSLLWLTGSSSLLSRVDDIYLSSKQLPLLTVVPNAVNNSEHSALMSVGVGFENNAHQAALYGIKILRDNVEPQDLPVGLLSPPDISISFMQAERLNTTIPFVLLEMASDIYADNGEMIRSAGMSMEKSNP